MSYDFSSLFDSARARMNYVPTMPKKPDQTKSGLPTNTGRTTRKRSSAQTKDTK